ncbi:protein cornichon homolog 4 [Trichoplusia ni]|uniref:Protein cornichon homolog 4 n=1 Tax=Trichoplusia ni TaxID=7111 RepID=A0A7E5WC37_TRINI|nr:protein cornichon homolog 4 [Trichoplusia ni]
MLLGETFLFSLTLIDCGGILFLLVYYIITLSDLECDYLNAQECCDKLNYWLLPKYTAHSIITILLLLHGQLILFLLNLPMFIWLTFEYFTVPRGNLGAYDPAEIHNRGQLRKHLRDVMIYVGYYLVFFFIYLYCFILALLKGDPLQRSADDQIVTEI